MVLFSDAHALETHRTYLHGKITGSRNARAPSRKRSTGVSNIAPVGLAITVWGLAFADNSQAGVLRAAVFRYTCLELNKTSCMKIATSYLQRSGHQVMPKSELHFDTSQMFDAVLWSVFDRFT